MQAALTTLLQGRLAAPPGTQTLQAFPVVQNGPPPLPAHCLDRAALVASLYEKLQRSGSLFLSGSAGMGKSTLAKLICARSQGTWLWLDLSGRNGTEVAVALHELAQRFERDGSTINVALDDLDASPAEF